MTIWDLIERRDTLCSYNKKARKAVAFTYNSRSFCVPLCQFDLDLFVKQ